MAKTETKVPWHLQVVKEQGKIARREAEETRAQEAEERDREMKARDREDAIAQRNTEARSILSEARGQVIEILEDLRTHHEDVQSASASKIVTWEQDVPHQTPAYSTMTLGAGLRWGDKLGLTQEEKTLIDKFDRQSKLEKERLEGLTRRKFAKASLQLTAPHNILVYDGFSFYVLLNSRLEMQEHRMPPTDAFESGRLYIGSSIQLPSYAYASTKGLGLGDFLEEPSIIIPEIANVMSHAVHGRRVHEFPEKFGIVRNGRVHNFSIPQTVGLA